LLAQDGKLGQIAAGEPVTPLGLKTHRTPVTFPEQNVIVVDAAGRRHR
jgi:hypothetical protein